MDDYPSDNLLILILIAAACIVLSSLFSASESAFLGLNKLRVHFLKEKGDKKAIRAGRLLERKEELLNMLLVGNEIVNVALSVVLTSIFLKLFGSAGLGIATFIATVALLIFGEITPKSLTTRFPEKASFSPRRPAGHQLRAPEIRADPQGRVHARGLRAHPQEEHQALSLSEKLMEKFDHSYLEMAQIWAQNSYCKRRKVGALLVKDRMIISDGYNGTPSGFENICEEDGVTKPYVLHAEANAITKVAKSGNSSEGATLYVTASPCLECSKLIIQSGIKRVVYRDEYRLTDGIDLLRRAGIEVERVD